MSDAHHHADHDFFVPAPSLWPPLTCLGAGVLMAGIVLLLHATPAILGQGTITVGLLTILLGAAGWFKDLINESRARGFKAVPLVLDLGNRYGMIFFIASEVMFFSAFFAAYFYLRMHNAAWPPANIATLSIDLPIINTLLLLTSGATITWAHHAVLHGRRSEAILATFLTWQLGVFFLVCQAVEYHHAAYTLSSGVYGTTFFMLTGFHGFHVFVGTLLLMVTHWRLTRGDFSRNQHFFFEAAAWYWHFVDVVWIGLFLFVYVL
ncbi:MAG TPA: cytochrome c oxidase subunit 3 [Alphaproteobacteria bacterium]|nr:cytochrome c oxidase subunit 3 [Alphaproteobacteria bacterium]